MSCTNAIQPDQFGNINYFNDSFKVAKFLEKGEIPLFSLQDIDSESSYIATGIYGEGKTHNGLTLLKSNKGKIFFVKWIKKHHRKAPVYNNFRPMKEARMAYIMGQLGVGPKVYGLLENETNVGIVMDYIRGDFTYPSLVPGEPERYSQYYNQNTIKWLERHYKTLVLLQIKNLDVQMIITTSGRPYLIDFNDYATFTDDYFHMNKYFGPNGSCKFDESEDEEFIYSFDLDEMNTCINNIKDMINF